MVRRVPILTEVFLFMPERWGLFIPLPKNLLKLLLRFLSTIRFGKHVSEINFVIFSFLFSFKL